MSHFLVIALVIALHTVAAVHTAAVYTAAAVRSAAAVHERQRCSPIHTPHFFLQNMVGTIKSLLVWEILAG